MMKKLENYLVSLLVLILISSCATQVPDVPLVTRLGPGLCYYVYTISDKKGEIDDNHPLIIEGVPYSCYDLILEGLIFPVYSYQEIKKFIQKTCKESKKCGSVGDWNDRLNSLESMKKTIDKN